MQTAVCSQLAVCRGLVVDWLHQIAYNDSMFHARRCCVSYGVGWSELYDKARHRREDNVRIQKDKTDGKTYAANGIYWFIIEGELVSPLNQITHKLSRVVEDGEGDYTWTESIVLSHAPSDRLPRDLLDGDAKEVGTIDCSFKRSLAHGSRCIKRLSRSWADLKPKKNPLYRVEHTISVLAQPFALDCRITVSENLVGETQISPVEWVPHTINYEG
jgi:hypothetical protein